MPQYRTYPIIAGPTASGKTALAVRLAAVIGGEVVSADSMQIYDDVSVGTARPTSDEMNHVPHHLLGFLPLQAKYSVAQYLQDAHAVFADIYSRGSVPVMCGGTGLYIQSFMENRQLFVEEPDPSLREQYMAIINEQGVEILFDRLRKIDPTAAGRLHPNDIHRIIRALEVYDTTGRTITEQTALSLSVPSPYRPCLIVLDFRDRTKLYDRINRRVDVMLKNGLLEEAKRILTTDPEATVTQAIGYKEFAAYFDCKISLGDAADKLRQQTRRYAKRQLSWFRRMKDAQFVYVDDYDTVDDLLDDVLSRYKSFG